MKKLIVSLLAVAGLVACSNEDVVRQQAGETIGFSGAFVENATRAEDPSITINTLDAFRVWSFMDEVTGVVLEDELVTKQGSLWSYANIQYWMPGHTYYFAALTPVDGNWALNTEAANKLGAGIVDFINVDGSEDLLYAATVRENSVLNGNAPVQLQFNHLLSKLNFTFENGFATKNITVDVKNVTMTAPQSASINLAVENWWDNNNDWVNLPEKNDLTLAFGDVETLAAGAMATAAKERLTIPADATREYTVDFDVVVYSGNIPTEFHKTATIKGAAFEMGKAYNLKATISPENLDLEAIEFQVVEVKGWDQPNDFDLGAINGEVKVVSTLKELQDVLDAATDNTTVVLGADLQGNVNVPELAGKTISINGNGKKFDGTFAIVGGSTYGEGTTVFSNINFETAALNGYDAFIYCNDQDAPNRYPDNVTIKDCTFKGTDTAVAAKFRSLNGNLVVENCKAEGIHSMLQLLSCGEAVVLVDGVEVVDCGRGFSLQYSTNIIRNTNVKAASYGVRLEGGAAATSIENSTIEATQPVIVRKLTTAGYTVNVDAATELKTAEAFQVIFTKGSDDAAYVAPEVAFTFNGPATTAVFPGFAPADATAVKNVEELTAALNDANVENIVLNEGVYGVIVAKSNKTIIAAEGAKVDAVVFNGSENVTLKNIVFDAAKAIMSYDGSGKTKQYANIMNDNNGGSNTPNKGASDIVIDGCTFTGAFANGGASIAFTDQSRKGGFTGNVTIKNCTFATTNAYYNIYGHYCGNSLNGKGNFVIENNTFNTEFTQGGPIYLGRYASNVPVVVKGNAFNTVASLGDAIYVQDHSSYGVSIAAENNTFAN